MKAIHANTNIDQHIYVVGCTAVANSWLCAANTKSYKLSPNFCCVNLLTPRLMSLHDSYVTALVLNTPKSTRHYAVFNTREDSGNVSLFLTKPYTILT